jgi:hypothetical protein
MWHHSDTLSRFQANQSLLFLLNAVYLAEKQKINAVYLAEKQKINAVYLAEKQKISIL